jgi:amino acid transporter
VAHTPDRGGALARQIGLYAATCITVGNIVGSGIFRSPHTVAQELPALGVVLAAWILGGVLSMCGSLALTELATAHPKTGGLYVFIREGFGNAWAFVFGWANLWVIKPTVIASIASVFAIYFCDALGLTGTTPQVLAAAAAILVLTIVNWLGVKEGAGTASVFTTLKIAGIGAMCVAAFVLPHSTPEVGAVPPAPALQHPLLLAIVLSMIPILFAYDGWTDSTYVGGEIRNPRRTLPIAIIGGTALVVVGYVITNVAYYHVLASGEIAQHEAVGAEMMRRILGDWGGRALAVLVAISTFGTINGAILTGPRVTQAMAAWIQAILSVLWLHAASGFEDVSGWFVTTSWLFYGVTIAALFVYRRRVARGDMPAGAYQTPLYPLTPIVFIVVTIGLIASDLSSSGWRAMAGVAVAALGFPVYYAWKGRRR